MPSDKKILMIIIILAALIFAKTRKGQSLTDITAVILGA